MKNKVNNTLHNVGAACGNPYRIGEYKELHVEKNKKQKSVSAFGCEFDSSIVLSDHFTFVVISGSKLHPK